MKSLPVCLFKMGGVALALWAVESLLIGLAPVPWLLGHVNADDFYYYLVLAQNTAAGLGPSFDGQELTNGFHPLYLILVTLLAKLPVDQPHFLIKASLSLLLLFHNGIAVSLAAVFERRGRAEIGTLAALLWLLNPWALAVTLHGVEVALATFLWALVIGYWLLLGSEGLTLKSIPVLGLLVGLAILARTDGLIWLGALWLTELFRIWRHPEEWRRHLLNIVALAGAVLVVTLPWWWWNWTRFEMIMQVSGSAIRLWTHGFSWLAEPDRIFRYTTAIGLVYVSKLLLYTALPLALTLLALVRRRVPQGQQDFATSAAKPVKSLAQPVETKPPAEPTESLAEPVEAKPSAELVEASPFNRVFHQLNFAWLAVLGLLIWYVGWQWNAQNWYLHSTILVFTVGAALAWEQAIDRTAPLDLRPTYLFVGLLAALIFFSGFQVLGFGYPRQARGYYLAQWLNHNTEPEARVGAWNSGIIAYFTDRQVINLDGVVNNSLYDHMKSRRSTSPLDLRDYVVSRNIAYITDYEYFHLDAFKEEVDLQLVYESPEYGFRVYRLKPLFREAVQSN
ncbi:MAG TPA: hypothetical protein PKE64_28110 [Anaerolineae bacterium]|nr:hypothetical protein [Anaerolineae bacterium]HMR67893.1 hypothetical protein [Anaerolineae bacterium]